MVFQQLLQHQPFLILMTAEMSVHVRAPGFHAHYPPPPPPPPPHVTKTESACLKNHKKRGQKRHQQYFSAWVGVVIDAAATCGSWSDDCSAVIEIGFLFSYTDDPPIPRPPPFLLHKLRDASYHIWQLQEGLLINVEMCSQWWLGRRKRTDYSLSIFCSFSRSIFAYFSKTI